MSSTIKYIHILESGVVRFSIKFLQLTSETISAIKKKHSPENTGWFLSGSPTVDHNRAQPQLAICWGTSLKLTRLLLPRAPTAIQQHEHQPSDYKCVIHKVSGWGFLVWFGFLH